MPYRTFKALRGRNLLLPLLVAVLGLPLQAGKKKPKPPEPPSEGASAASSSASSSSSSSSSSSALAWRAAPAGSRGTRVQKGRVITVNGHHLKPRVNLRGVGDLAGTDLRWVDLRHANLSHADLSWADLSGADLSYANLTGTNLAGAVLDGTRLVEAQIFGAIGGDFRKSRLHPFFSQAEPEEVGTVRLFISANLDGKAETFNTLASGPNGALYWPAAEQGSLLYLSKTGSTTRFGLPSKPRITAMTRDLKQGLWLSATDEGGVPLLAYLDLNRWEKEPLTQRVPISCIKGPWLTAPPVAMFATPSGGLMVSTGASLYTVAAVDETFLVTKLPLPDFGSLDHVAFPAKSRSLCFIDTTQNHLVALKDDQHIDVLKIDGDRSLSGLAVGEDGRLWTVRPGDNHVFVTDLEKDPVEVLTLPLPEGSGGANHITRGPDGNLWATATQANRILRITPAGKVNWYGLPPGTEPLEIMNYQDGKLLFTTRRGDRFGSIRALRSKGEPQPEIPFAPAVQNQARVAQVSASSLPEPEADHGAELAASHQRAEERLEDLLAEAPLDLSPSAEATPAAEEESKEGPLPKSASSASPSQRPEPYVSGAVRLHARNVNLTGGALRHILGQHGAGHQPGKSQFSPAFSAAQALEELLATGLLEAKQTGLFGRVKMSDDRARSYTVCTAATPVGSYLRFSERLPTNRFVILSLEQFDPFTGRTMHDVLTAYPVAPDW